MKSWYRYAGVNNSYKHIYYTYIHDDTHVQIWHMTNMTWVQKQLELAQSSDTTSHVTVSTLKDINKFTSLFVCARNIDLASAHSLGKQHTDKSNWINLKSDCIYHFPVDLDPNGRQFRSKSTGLINRADLIRFLCVYVYFSWLA